MVRSDYPEGCIHPILGDLSPEARPDLWEFCPYCTQPVRAPGMYTGDMCHCHLLATGERVSEAPWPHEGLLAVQYREHERGCECFAEGGCSLLIGEEDCIDCDLQDVLEAPEQYELLWWSDGRAYIRQKKEE